MRNFLQRTFCVLIFVLLPIAVLAYIGGSGTEDDPYLIANKADLLYLGTNTADYSKHFIMLTNIDLAGEVFGRAVIAPDTDDLSDGFQGEDFTGVFDGNGYVIKNLTINTLGVNSDYLGLFGRILDSTDDVESRVCNLGIENVMVSGGIESKYIGGLCAYSRNTIFTNCFSIGDITGGDYLGVLCGSCQNEIVNCYSIGTVTGGMYLGVLTGYCYGDILGSYSTGTVTGSGYLGGVCGYYYLGELVESWSAGLINGGGVADYVGGLCGYSKYGDILKCYSSVDVIGVDYIGGLCGASDADFNNSFAWGSVTGSSIVGGLCGMNGSGTIDQCYAVGSISGNREAGGLCGSNDVGTVTSSFWDLQTSGQIYSAGGVGKTTVEMQKQSTFTFAGWDFGYMWRMDDYPLLQSFPSSPVVTFYSGGSGTIADPYKIASKADLFCLRTNTVDYSKHFIMTADIDLAEDVFTNAVIAWNTEEGVKFCGTPFKGSFNGDGHVIRNLKIEAGDG